MATIKKELSIEEKARRYDEAIERAREYVSKDDVEVTEYIFPELAESEDERIRKAIYLFVESYGAHSQYATQEDMLAWLEKQVEKNTTWSEEDERFLNVAINILNSSKVYTKSPDKYEDTINWLNSLKGRVGCEVKCTTIKEWNEEDEKFMIAIFLFIESYGHQVFYEVGKNEALDWLKSLKDRVQSQNGYNPYKRIKPITAGYSRTTWKPSDEQMDALRYVANFDYGGHKATLVSLYEQLKKLMEE